MWHACERFGIQPPGVESAWDECDVVTQAALLAYDQLRTAEDVKGL